VGRRHPEQAEVLAGVGVVALLPCCLPGNWSVQLSGVLAGKGELETMGVAGGCKLAMLSRLDCGLGQPPPKMLSSFGARFARGMLHCKDLAFSVPVLDHRHQIFQVPRSYLH